MIVDVHTMLWHAPDQLGPAMSARLRREFAERWDRPDMGAEACDAALEPVDYALVLGLESALAGASIPVEQVARTVARQPGKYIGFAGIDPMAPRPIEALDRAQSLKLSGVVIAPAGQGFHPAHSRAMALYEACADRKLPIVVLSSATLSPQARLEFAQPALLDEIARTFPTLRLVVTQMGLPFVEQTLVLIDKHEHVYADLAGLCHRRWQLYQALLAAHQLGVVDKLLFGSGFPLCTPEEAITTVYSTNNLVQGTGLPTIPREQLRRIIEHDALAALGLEPPRHNGGGNIARPAGLANGAGAVGEPVR